MNDHDITRAIEDRAAPDFGLWTIGITEDPKATRRSHDDKGEDLKDWLEWPADSKDIARAVRDHFIDEGMKETEGGDAGNPTFVYIF